jgi:hypothetical protein
VGGSEVISHQVTGRIGIAASDRCGDLAMLGP